MRRVKLNEIHIILEYSKSGIILRGDTNAPAQAPAGNMAGAVLTCSVKHAQYMAPYMRPYIEHA